MYELKLRVRFSEVDEKNELTSLALLNYLQDCCTMHSEDVGFGLPWLFENHLGWFVVGWQIQMYRMPHMGEYVSIKTFPTKVKGFFGVRDFTVKTEEGELLAKAHSEWVLMNHEKGKPARVPEDMIEAYALDEPVEGPWEKAKIKAGNNENLVRTFKVSHTQLDYNGHMNNVFFLQMAQAALLDEEAVSLVRIEFRNQAKEDDCVYVYRADTEDGCTVSLKDEEGLVFAILCFRLENHHVSIG